MKDSPQFVERRASVRHASEMEITFHETKAVEPQQWPSRVHDISSSGIGLIVDRAFAIGSVLGIELQSFDEMLAYTMMARVVRTVRQANGEWLIGCAFLRSLSEIELDTLL